MTDSARKAVAGAIVASVLPFVALALLLPQVFSLRKPLAYSGDGLSHAVLVKSVLEAGWFPTHNPRLGAPFGATWFDYPNADAANLLILKIIGLFSNDWIIATNVFYLITFALTSVIAFSVLQRLGLRWLYALVAALLFAELPYHFLRSVHLLLAAYWSVPIAVYLAIICGPQANALRFGDASSGRWSRALMAIGVGCGGIYYAFFGIVLIAVAGFANLLAERRWRAILPAATIAAIAVATVVAQLGPTFVYWYENGTNSQVAQRPSGEAELFAFKPIQLLLPQSEHRIRLARDFANGYARSAPLVNENASASLGIVGVTGLAFILVYGLRRLIVDPPFDPPLESLAWQSVAALALGTVGGFGSVLAQAGFTSIRAYNRISVFLGFIGIASVFLVLQRALPAVRDSRVRAYGGAAAAIALALAGTLDQLPVTTRDSSKALQNDQRFFAELERSLSPGTSVYQLPYHPYPESGPMNAMADYDLARGYLHTDTLRWSYGAMKGRPGDAWLRSVAEKTLPGQLDIAAQSGFGAVYIDRRGYEDHGEAVEAVLRSRVGKPIATSDDGNLAAYVMHATGKSPVPLATVLPKWETPIRFDRPTLSPRIERLTGFSDAEPTGRWTDGAVARIEFFTPLPRRFLFRMETLSAMPQSANADLHVYVDRIKRDIRVVNGPTVTETTFDLPSDRSNVIEIRIPEPSSPRDVGIGPDTRRLGIHISAITIVPK